MPRDPLQDTFERDVLARMRQALRTARMWGSPEELEAVAQHFSHVLLTSRTPGWTFEQTAECWTQVGSPLAGDAEEHASMRARLWGEDEETSRAQVVAGFACVWAALERQPVREVRVGPWIEALLDAPARVDQPDLLDMVLFTLMGFVASSPAAFVESLSFERKRRGGHERRALHVVGPLGRSPASLTWTRRFESWDRVAAGVEALVALLELPKGQA
jgi:hypothetical protein